MDNKSRTQCTDYLELITNKQSSIKGSTLQENEISRYEKDQILEYGQYCTLLGKAQFHCGRLFRRSAES